MTEFTLSDIGQHVGKELGVSGWLTVDQSRIDQFAECSGDRQWIHVDVERAKRTIETDRLRSALLTSISHDLKTPLAAVLGAATTLRDLSGALSDSEKAELLATVVDESERLNRFITNLLDMTKLESGAVVPKAGADDQRSRRHFSRSPLPQKVQAISRLCF